MSQTEYFLAIGSRCLNLRDSEISGMKWMFNEQVSHTLIRWEYVWELVW